ncbi:bile acid:sodium symporter [Corticibacter populi]|uniref:Bile acid:sodium symporter n=1 Tax=Corticibacter populi TaxID=1550736 RepID=A0A3M6QZ07_9BURK|nr:bile acid:sodium symporter family protein [Corticibacter populi]RMX07752.1 bile acid:sodium symporter [Corticibacter populi]RZS34973.1 sodium/bile acid cotransporter 7 [Corticibacter populi]
MPRLRFLPDRFVLVLLGTVLLASLLPPSGRAAIGFEWLTNAAIALLFFMHGAKLSRESIIAGVSHWRLHLLVFAFTFALFPLLGLLMRPMLEPLIGPELMLGMLYLCALPATVQSAIAFTSMARGNIPAAICSAAASSLLGVFITPILVLWLMGVQGGDAAGSVADAIGKITLQLLVPFIAGQIARRWIGGWVARNKQWLKYVDQGSILLVIYTAFGRAVHEGLWQQVPLASLLLLLLACALLLALVLAIVWWGSKALGFDLPDRITILFCGSKKSLATGVPMAQVLFAGGAIGAMILPVMLFHQIQLMVCAYLAQRFAQRKDVAEDA